MTGKIVKYFKRIFQGLNNCFNNEQLKESGKYELNKMLKKQGRDHSFKLPAPAG